LMAGVNSGNRLADAWRQAYTSKYCPDFDITFEANLHDSAAARVCASSLLYEPADIAGMPGGFYYPQAETDDGWSFRCKRSTLERDTILVSFHHHVTLSYCEDGVQNGR
jgi:hypothetical protein